MVAHMKAWEAALWGLAGGAASGLLSLMTVVASNGFTWPWEKREAGPRLFVLVGGLILGALVAAAASSQMSGPWPAFVIGAGAPATIRGLLGGIQVDSNSLTLKPLPRAQGLNQIETLAQGGSINESTP